MTADNITADDILEEFHRTTHPQRRSDVAKQRLKGHNTAEWLMGMNALGGCTALEIICRVLELCMAQDESLTLGDALEGEATRDFALDAEIAEIVRRDRADPDFLRGS